MRALPPLLLDLSTELLAVFEDECFVVANKRWAEVLGWLPDELLGRSYREFVHPDDLRPTEELDGPATGFANRYRHKDGGWRWLLWETRVMPDGLWFCAARDITREREAIEARERVLEEHAALRRVATCVAAIAAPEEVFSSVSAEAGKLLGADAACVARILPEGRVELMGGWMREGAPPVVPGAVLEVVEGVDLQAIFDRGRTLRVDDTATSASVTGALGFGSSLTSPVLVEGRDWGLLIAVHRLPHGFAADADERLREFAALTAMAVANAEARRELEQRALTDPLTQLMNHRAFHERLRAEVERARRHGRPLTLVVLDLDEFKAVNDTFGHQEGDRVLAAVAAAIRANGRLGDLVGRIGGDELALILTECDARDAEHMLDRLRPGVAAISPLEGRPLTFSAGVCDLVAAETAEDLLHRADRALYASKHLGRARTTVCD